MSRVVRTNKWLQHSRSLIELSKLSQNVHQREAIFLSVAFAIEKTLVSLVYEILERNEATANAFNIEHILSSTDESMTQHWLIKQIKEHRQIPHHWLHQLWLSRTSMSEIPTGAGVPVPPDVNNINLIAVHSEPEVVVWVDECHQLIVDARALNSYE